MTLRLPTERPAILSFRGPDAVRYLNGQMTQDAAGLGDESRPACVTDAKGKLQHFVSVMHGPAEGEIWIVAPTGSGAALRERLERYLIADEVEIENLEGRWERIHAAEPLPDATFSRSALGVFGEGFDHWWPAGEVPESEALDPAEIESRRIAAGIPAWGAELDEGMLPPEAGLDRRAISYTKGCYIGQEVLSRIKSVGKVNRRLARFTTTATEPGPLFLGGKEVGVLTSIAPAASDDGSHAALGYLKKTAYGETAFVSPGGATATFLDWA